MDKVVILTGIAVGALLLWRTISTIGAVLEAYDIHVDVGEKEKRTKKRLQTMRGVEKRNAERIRAWENKKHG